jgi:4'-phosphopantetheinyl transferase
MEACLSADELQRARQCVFADDRAAYVVCRAILRKILGACLGVDPAQLAMERDRYDKPRLKGRNLSFNLSHSDGRAAIGVARHRRVGIDIEKLDPRRPVMRLAKRFFTHHEAEKIGELGTDDDRQRAFHTCWTRKEAYVKALGKGLLVPTASFEVGLLPGEPVQLLTRQGTHTVEWELRDFDAGAGYAGAIAIEGHGWQLRSGRWDERGIPDDPDACKVV